MSLLCRAPVYCLCLFLLAACANSRVLTQWPQTVPDQDIFLQAYEADPDNQQRQSAAQYLTWVVRFYEGWELMATGWNDMTPVMVDDLEEPLASEVASLRDELGVMIAAEWAKDNSVRVIDTAMLSLWGGVMVDAVEPDVRVDAIELITDDVEQLLAGELAPASINDARYTARLDLDSDW